jgi:multicomponent Na+:H+ antiporter subunit D
VSDIHPAVPLLVAALLAPLLGRWARFVGLFAPAVGLAFLFTHSGETTIDIHLIGERLRIVHIDALSKVFALAFLVFSLVANIFAWNATKTRELAFALVLAAGGVSVVLAGDLASLFFGWELLSVASVLLVWSAGTIEAQKAGLRYLFVHVAGGVCLLAGVVLQYASPGGGALDILSLSSPGVWLILLGFAVNAAIPPLHAWLPDAYPRASIFGSVWLTAFTTKAAVYALARCFAGAELLIWAGSAMAIYGVVFALMENDLRRLLSYHIVSQVGFMVAGVGLGTELALDGATAHAFSHIFYKGLLMMSVAAIIHATNRSKLTELGGLARRLPAVLVLFLIGAVSISGLPLFNGFISKSMTIAAAASSNFASVEILLTVASVGTFVSITAKITYFAFIIPAEVEVETPIPRSMFVAMGLAAALCFGLGIVPDLLYALLPYRSGDYHPYTIAHVAEALQIAAVSMLGFWLLRRPLASAALITRDFDRVYVLLATSIVRALSVILQGTRTTAEAAEVFMARAYDRGRNLLSAPAATNAPVGVQVAVLILLSLGVFAFIAIRSRS